MRKFIRYTLIGFAIIFIILQFFRSDKNQSGDTNKDISTLYAMPEPVKQILATACNDCHSNKTVYPWYSNIQPVAWWLNDHVEEGKGELNFNTFASYRIYRQYHKMDKLIEEVEEEEMPLSSYTLIHRNAILDDNQKNELITWAKGIQQQIKATYPPDSLERPKRTKT